MLTRAVKIVLFLQLLSSIFTEVKEIYVRHVEFFSLVDLSKSAKLNSVIAKNERSEKMPVGTFGTSSRVRPPLAFQLGAPCITVTARGLKVVNPITRVFGVTLRGPVPFEKSYSSILVFMQVFPFLYHNFFAKDF